MWSQWRVKVESSLHESLTEAHGVLLADGQVYGCEARAQAQDMIAMLEGARAALCAERDLLRASALDEQDQGMTNSCYDRRKLYPKRCVHLQSGWLRCTSLEMSSWMWSRDRRLRWT